jgi:hypothetical protein
MTTDPGDLVMDITCGSGTTAYVAEQWGRRWITCDTSRVPLALARQRLLTATFPWYRLKNPSLGPAGGFVYERKQNRKGEEIGGLVPRITLKSIANNEEPEMVTLVDRPEQNNQITRVCGPFTVEATIQAAQSLQENDGVGCAEERSASFEKSGANDAPPRVGTSYENRENPRRYLDRMIEVLRQSKTLRLPGNVILELASVRPLADREYLHAECSGQWSVGSGQRSEEGGYGEELPGIIGLAEGNGNGSSGLSDDERFPEGGNLRPHESDAAGGGFRAEQYRRGAGANDQGGVHPISGTGAGIADGVGNPGAIGATTGFSDPASSRNATLADGGNRTASQRANLQPEKLTTGNRSLTTAHIAIVFGPEDGAIGSEYVFNAHTEALQQGFQQLFLFGFAIQAKAREMLEKLKIKTTYVAMTPDIVMSDLLKTSKASEIFSITGLPDITLKPAGKRPDGTPLHQVEVQGLDIFRPDTMETDSIEAENLPCWMLDTNYSGLVFCAFQVFFPKTGAWDNLQKSLKGEFSDSVWQHLAGTVSEPFALGDQRRIAVKVIDDRGNELMVVKTI